MAQNKPVLQSIDKDEISNYSALGQIISSKLLKNLKSELMIAIKEGGTVSAINTCNIKAIPLTNELIKTDNTIKEIKRVSDKSRNPENSPDSLETEALTYFVENYTQPNSEYLQKYRFHDSTFINYYQPIKVGSFCLRCHGKVEKIDKDVAELIEQLYPDDKAKDYEVDDLRGAIKITFIK